MIPLLLLLTALARGLAPSAASAAAIIEAGSTSAAAGRTGSFDILLTSTGGSFNVSAFSVELSVPSSSGVTFTGAGTGTTTASYLFSTLQSPPMTFATFPTTDFIASDSSVTSPFFATIAPGQTVGLEHVTYSVAASAPSGVVPISIMSIGTDTQLLDLSDTLIPASGSNGSITVAGSAVPEPSSLVLTLIGGVTLFAAGRI
jgi:hypothetical protein